MRCSKQPPYSITLSAWPSNEGGLDSALAFRRQLDRQNLLAFSPFKPFARIAAIGPYLLRAAWSASWQCEEWCNDAPVGRPPALLQTAAVQPLHKHYVDAASNQISESRRGTRFV
jgi:hypothetical protein